MKTKWFYIFNHISAVIGNCDGTEENLYLKLNLKYFEIKDYIMKISTTA